MKVELTDSQLLSVRYIKVDAGVRYWEDTEVNGEDAYFFTVKHKARQMYDNILKFFSSPQRAYADLIDKISGKGTWESNPWVGAYSFELVD